jgi:hypothetical protein
MNTLRILLTVLCLSLLAACGGGGGGDAPPPQSLPPSSGSPTATVTVTVIDTQGRFVAGAQISSPSGSASSDANGVASLPVATGSEQLVVVSKTGFAEQVKPVTLANGRSVDLLRVMLIERDTAVDIAAIEGGGSASGRDGVKVTFPAGALVDGTGSAVTGTIQMQMTPVDVSALDAEAFPGAFAGVPSAGVRGDIMSYGTAELLPLKNGQKLQLAAGKSAQIELPIYAGVHQDGSAVEIGNTIALWSLSTNTGVWTQEGSGTVVSSAASPSGKALRATITHFSWWNGDVSAQMGTVNLTVHVPNPNAPIATGTLASVTGQVVAGSGPRWVAQATVPVEVATALRVPSNATTRLAARVDLPTQVCAGTADVSPAPDATVDATISAVCFTVPVPTIVEPATGKVTNSTGTLTVRTTIAGSPPDALDILVDGTLDVNQHLGFAQFFYTTAWNLAPLSEGTHSLVARATRTGVTRDSAPVTITIDRTAPHEVAINPTPGGDVTPGTQYTVDFDEPVNPGFFTLSDAVKLTITPIGQTTPQPLQATLVYDDVQRRLSATLAPNQTLPLGTVGLSWGVLQDGAGNAVTGTLAATWTVARTTTLTSLGIGSPLVLAANAAGTVFELHRRSADNQLVASRVDGSALVPIGPAINDRALTIGGGEAGSIAVDANGQVFVAFVQTAANGTSAEVVVKRFDANTNAWVTLVAPFALPGNVNASALPRLQTNAGGQPVLVYSTAAFNPLPTLKGFRFDGSSWVDLGSLSGNLGGHVMRLDANGNPIVAYLEGTGGSNAARLKVLRNTGNAWLALGGVLDSTPDATQSIGLPSLAIDGAGQPWLAWNHVPGAPLNLVRFDGSAFVPVVVTTPSPLSGHPALAFVGADPVIVMGDDSGIVLRFHNSAWEAPLPLAIDSRGPVDLVASNGALVIAVTGNGNGVGTLLKVAFP